MRCAIMQPTYLPWSGYFNLISQVDRFVFLDDVYALCEPDRARFIFDALAEALRRRCGIEVNLGKSKVWNSGGFSPNGFGNMGSP